MRLTFQEESWNDIVEELKPLFALHFTEEAVRHPRLALAPDYEGYAARDRAGILSLTTARDGDQLVGYFLNYVVPSPHYRTTLYGMMDTHYLAPAYRDAQNAMRFFLATEKIMRARGATELLANTKVGLDASALFERLGWRRAAITYAKSLGDK